MKRGGDRDSARSKKRARYIKASKAMSGSTQLDWMGSTYRGILICSEPGFTNKATAEAGPLIERLLTVHNLPLTLEPVTSDETSTTTATSTAPSDPEPSTSNSTGDDLDIGDAIAAELQELKDAGSGKNVTASKTVVWSDSGCQGLVFFRFKSAVLDPVLLSKTLMATVMHQLDLPVPEDAPLTEDQRAEFPTSRFITRVVPVSHTVPASIERIVEAIPGVIRAVYPDAPVALKDWKFPLTAAGEKPTFCVILRKRLTQLERTPVFTAVADALEAAGAKVRMDEPDMVFVIEAFKGVAALGLVPEFHSYSKFSLRAAQDKALALSQQNKSTAVEAQAD